MKASGQAVISYMEQLAPKYLAVEDDRIGLQLGSLTGEVTKVLVALDVTEAVVEEAIQNQVELIIAHHAIIFRPLRDLRTDTPAGMLYERLIKNDIAVYIAHTNLDTAEGGINDLMAAALGLTETRYLDKVYTEPASQSEGGADRGASETAQGRSYGLGRVGKLGTPCTLDELADRVKVAFDVPFIRIVGDGQRMIRKAAVLGGKGDRYVHKALFAGADVLITGDIDYHTAHDALAAGLTIIDPGHNIEKIMKESVASYLNEKLQKKYHSTQAIASAVNTEVFRIR